MEPQPNGKIRLDGQIAYGLLSGNVFGTTVELPVQTGETKTNIVYRFNVSEHNENDATGTIDIGNGQLRKLIIRPIGGPNLTTCWCRYEVSEIPEEEGVHKMD